MGSSPPLLTLFGAMASFVLVYKTKNSPYKDELSELSYSGLKTRRSSCEARTKAGTTRLELATSCVTGMRSNQLSYAPVIIFNFKF